MGRRQPLIGARLDYHPLKAAGSRAARPVMGGPASVRPTGRRGGSTKAPEGVGTPERVARGSA